jgi:hypothetical protein
MDCARTEDILSAYLDGDLPEREREEVALHLRTCPRCAEEERALRETVSLLRSLPVEKAPPGLLQGVRRHIGEENAAEPLWKKLFLPAHVKIPLEAAAVVLVFLLVYGIQKQIPATKSPASPPASVRSETATAGQTTTVPDRRKPITSRTRRIDAADRKGEVETAPAETMKKRAKTSPGKAMEDMMDTAPAISMEGKAAMAPDKPLEEKTEMAPAELMEEKFAMTPGKSEADAAYEKERTIGSAPRPEEPAEQAKAKLPAVPATRVSTGSRAIESAIPRDAPSKEARAPRVFAAPPSRLFKPLPYGREVTIEVDRDARIGLNDRIAVLAKRVGGKILRERIRIAGSAGKETVRIMDILQVNVPTVSADIFLEELGKLGTIPPEGMPGKVDIPAGPTPGTVTYTVRIIVR